MNYAITRRGVGRRRNRILSSLETKKQPNIFLKCAETRAPQRLDNSAVWPLLTPGGASPRRHHHWSTLNSLHSVRPHNQNKTLNNNHRHFFVCFFITLAERGKYCSLIFETQVLITSTWNWAFFFEACTADADFSESDCYFTASDLKPATSCVGFLFLLARLLSVR